MRLGIFIDKYICSVYTIYIGNAPLFGFFGSFYLCQQKILLSGLLY